MTADTLPLQGIIHGLEEAYERDDPKNPQWLDGLLERADR